MITGKASTINHDVKKSTGRVNVLLGGFLLSAVLWIVGSAVTWQTYENETEKAWTRLEHLGTRLALQTSISIENVDRALIRTVERFSNEWESLINNPLQTHEFVLTAFTGLQHLKDIVVLDTSGKALYHHRFDFDLANKVNDETFITGMLLSPQRRLYIGGMNLKDAIGLSRPVYSNKGILLGYILAKIRSDYLKQIYETGLEKKRHQFALYSPNGLVFSIPNQLSFTHNVSIFGDKKTKQETVLEHRNEEKILIAHTKVPNYDLAITTEIPFRYIIGQWKRDTVVYGAIGVIFSVIILIAAFLLQRNMQRLHDEVAIRREAEIHLKQLSRAVEQSPASVVITDMHANIQYVNPKFTQVTGYAYDEVIGQNPRILSADQDPRPDYEDMWKKLLSGGEWRGQFFNKRKDGTTFWESASLSAIKNSKGEITNFLAVKEDITRQKEAEDQLQMAAAVFEAASEAIMVCDGNNIIETVNESFTDITGYTMDEVIGQTPSLLKSGRHSDEFYKKMVAALTHHGKWEGEIWNRRKNGEIYPQWLSIKTIQDETGKAIRYISLFSDITNRKQDEERILYQANYDALTGLPNRSLFMDRLQRAIARAERARTKIALLFIDLDRFKNINDSLGHACGDLLLQEAAKRLTSLVRKSDTVARLGGDEFTVIIQDLTDYRLIENLVEKLLDQLSAAYTLENNVAFVSASIGITIFPNDGHNVEELLKNADTAMYQAKDNGRNLSQFFTQEMNNEAHERRALETALHQALEREEFVLHYQPIIDVETQQLSSCEVLLRWHQPEHGNVYPDKFIPLAEDTGLILPIGEWVLLDACREAMIWAKHSKSPPNVSVNMSSRQFQRENVVNLVSKTLKKTGLPAERLTLEITESLLVGDDKSILDQLHEIRNLGCGLSIDDFGTGYSSLSYLRRFPITTLKIDRAFITDVTNNGEAAALVSAILSMAKSLNLKVVAEGVETMEQFTHLKNEGCDFIQGYYFSPPVPIEAFRLMAKKEGAMQPDE